MKSVVNLGAQEALATLNRRRLILFVHGLGGNAEGTWGPFPELVRTDVDLVALTVATHEYPTARWRLLGKASVQIEQLAQELSTKLDTTFAGYAEVVIAAHSMGGVIVRKMLVERAKREKLDRIKAIVLYAVPNMGSSIATLGAMLSRGHRHLAQLKTNSAFLNSLNEDWAALGCGRRVAVRHVVGGQDKIVPHHSSRAPWAGAELDAVSDADHGSIVKPTDSNHLSYDILKRAALGSGPIDVSVAI